MSQPIEAEIVHSPSQAVAVRPPLAVDRPMDVNDIVAQVKLVQDVMARVMHDGEHYGKIPGCGDKATLLLPGAQKLTLTFRLAPEYVIQETNFERGHKEYRVVCTLRNIQSGLVWGQGVGCCTTLESKYRYRGGARKCPQCGKEAIIKGKAEFGGGWLCWQKKNGCGAKWPDGAAEIEGQNIDKVENENPADCFNTVLKIAKKRAYVDATITATAASDIFTQDIGDNEEEAEPKQETPAAGAQPKKPDAKAASPKPATPPAAAPATTTAPARPASVATTPAPAAKPKETPKQPPKDPTLFHVEILRGLRQGTKEQEDKAQVFGKNCLVEFLRRVNAMDSTEKVPAGSAQAVLWCFAVDWDWILPNEGIDVIPITKAPLSAGEFNKCMEAIRAVLKEPQHRNDAVRAYQEMLSAGNEGSIQGSPSGEEPASPPVEGFPPRAEGPPPEVQEAINNGAASPGMAKPPVDDESWRDVIVPVPNKGQKRDEYIKNPDTIGSLFEKRHGDDEEAAMARRRLFGFVNNYVPSPWKKRDGTEVPPSEADVKFREALDRFAEYFSKYHPDENL